MLYTLYEFVRIFVYRLGTETEREKQAVLPPPGRIWRLDLQKRFRYYLGTELKHFWFFIVPHYTVSWESAVIALGRVI